MWHSSLPTPTREPLALPFPPEVVFCLDVFALVYAATLAGGLVSLS